MKGKSLLCSLLAGVLALPPTFADGLAVIRNKPRAAQTTQKKENLVAPVLSSLERALMPTILPRKQKKRARMMGDALETLYALDNKEGLQEARNLFLQHLLPQLGNTDYTIRSNAQKTLEELVARDRQLGLITSVKLASLKDKDLHVRFLAKKIVAFNKRVLSIPEGYRSDLIALAPRGKLRKYVESFERLRKYVKKMQVSSVGYETGKKNTSDVIRQDLELLTSIGVSLFNDPRKFFTRCPYPTKDTPKFAAVYNTYLYKLAIGDLKHRYARKWAMRHALRRLSQRDAGQAVRAFFYLVDKNEAAPSLAKQLIRYSPRTRPIIREQLLERLEHLQNKPGHDYISDILTVVN